MYLRCIGLWITVHIGTCFYSISLIETFPGQYLFIIIAICQYYCLLFSISHLLFHLRSGVYYFSLKTVPSFLKLNQYKFNLTWREWLPPRQSLCYSLLLAVPDAARFCVLWQNHGCIQAGASTWQRTLSSLSLAGLAYLQKQALWLRDWSHCLVHVYIHYRSDHNSSAWAECPVRHEIPWQWAATMQTAACTVLHKPLCSSFFGAKTKRFAEMLSWKIKTSDNHKRSFVLKCLESSTLTTRWVT